MDDALQSHLLSPTTPTPPPTSSSLPQAPLRSLNVYSQVAIMFSQSYSAHLQYMCRRPSAHPSSAAASDSYLQIHGDRESMLHSLLKSYILPPLIKSGAIRPVQPALAGVNHLLKFHDLDYLKMIKNGPPSVNSEGERVSENRKFELLERYNLVDDCAVPSSDEGRQELWKYCQAVAGGSLHAAGMLKAYEEGNPSKGEKVINTAINWGGGRHHAHRSMGGGFCWVNDTVLALQLMRRKFGKVLYLDIDIHHADGVEEAFITSRSVVTVSMHKYGHGFFPGTGGWDKAHGPNNNPGHFHTLNVPLPDHVTDEDFVPFYQETLAALIEGHREHSPTGEFKAVCLAVGADGLHGDPIVGLDGWSLSTHGLARAVAFTARTCDGARLPLLVLGGGGYNDANAVRTFATCTVAACEGVRPEIMGRFPDTIPEHEFFPKYAPDFMIHTQPTKRGTHSGSDSGRKSAKIDAGMDDARSVVSVSVEGLIGVTSGGIKFDDDDVEA